jgi:lipopolysaccharide/colanic/teichoic acid biosynthesis glycosyltransferase
LARSFNVAYIAVDQHGVTDSRISSGIDAEAFPAPVPRRGEGFVEVSCRALDIVGSAALLLILAPLLGLIAIAVRLDSPGPAIFRQQRVGRARKPFMVNKFRSMGAGVAHDRHREFVLGLIKGEQPPHNLNSREAAGEIEDQDDPNDQHSGPRPYYKMIGDPRVTRVGRLLRRSSLDELPQLWNVLRGDMSLVGPRPPIPYEVEHYPAEWFGRFAVKPGITGLWQVSGRSSVTLDEMVRLDIEYARRRTVWLNILILARTIPTVLLARGAW